MQIYEYMCLFVDEDHAVDARIATRKVKRYDRVEEVLNTLSEEGWELVSASGPSYPPMLYMRRAKQAIQ